MRFVVTGYTAQGGVERRSVDAESESEARVRSGFSPGRIKSIRRGDSFGNWLAQITRQRPKPEIQAVFMASLSAIVLAGQVHRGIDRLLAQYRRHIQYNPTKLREQTKISDMLAVLNFEPLAVTLVQVGEKTGEVSRSLTKASSTLIYQLKLKEELGKDLVLALVYIALGLAVLGVAVFVFSPFLIEMGNEKGITFPKNFATDTLLFLYSWLLEYWPILMGAVAMTFTYRRIIWFRVRGWPVVNWVWSVQQLRNALFFLAGFEPLFIAGVTEDKAFQLLRAGSGSSAQRAYTSAIEKINEGAPLSVAIDNEEWPDSFRAGMSGYESAPQETKIELLSGLTEVLILQQRVMSRRLSKLAKLVGMCIAIGAVLLMVFGAVLPLQQMSPA
jgi:type II secretory pathway component PulF